MSATLDLRLVAAELREDGLSIRQIARELNVPPSTVHGWLRAGKDTGRG